MSGLDEPTITHWFMLGAAVGAFGGACLAIAAIAALDMARDWMAESVRGFERAAGADDR